MERKTRSRAEALLRAKKQKTRWLQAVSVMACIVAFCTTYALILPAITLSKQPVCGQEEHIHTEECYTTREVLRQVCAPDVHTHTADCEDETGNLICGYADFVAHKHSDLCDSNGALVCTLEEREPHEHTAAECYTLAVTCGQEATEGHTHSDACYALICGQEESEAHSHTPDCYDYTALVCGQEASEGHTHTDACNTLTLTCEKETLLLHTHTADCFDEDGNLICGKIQILEHVHTEDCFRLAQETVLTCTLQEHTHTEECYPAPAETGQETTAPTEDRTPQCGREPHIHGSDCYAPAAEGAEAVRICEQEEHTHSEECYIAAPAETQPEESRGMVYFYRETSLEVSVALPEGSTVPEDAVLTVRPITQTEESYDTLVSQAEEVSGEAATIHLYEIGFRTPEEGYLPVSEEAMVTIRFLEPLQESAEAVTVLHYAGEAEPPVVLNVEQISRDENDALSELTFQTDGFSVFAVVTVTSVYQQVTDLTALEGKTAAILSHSAKYAMMPTATSEGDGCLAQAVASMADLSAYTVWTFEKSGDGYYIHSDENYLVMGAGTLTTTAGKDQATLFTIKITAGRAEIGADVDGTQYYVNLNGGEGSPGGFKSYVSSNNNLQQLYIEPSQASSGATLDNLGGESYVIANLNTADRQYAMNATASSSAGRLSATPVSVVVDGDTTYVSGDALTTWTFITTDTPGVYYIQADTGKYLNLTDLTNGGLTTGDSKQAITVSTSSDYSGQVRLSANNTAVNWYGGGDANNLVFGPYSDSGKNEYQSLCKKRELPELLYDLNLPSLSEKGIGWETEPSLDSVIQIMEGATALYGKPKGSYSEEGPAGLSGLYRFTIRDTDSGMAADQTTLSSVTDTWYGEERFDGWEYVDSTGVTHLFAPEAALLTKENGEVQAVDTGGTTVTIPAGTVLRGKWTEVSNVVTFFVNYTGTILDKEGDVDGRDNGQFTRAVAVGHVFYGEQKVGTDGHFATAVNQQITAMFRNAFDPDDPDTQIVVECLRTCTSYNEDTRVYTTAMDTPAKGANSHMLEASTLKILKETGRSVQISTEKDVSPTIDNSLCDANHYEVRWYVLKEQTDTWHIDGVLVAKTAELAVTKTFSGLKDEQVAGIMGKYNMPVELGENPQYYLTMTTESIDGQYNYYDREHSADGSVGGHSYNWILNTITDEQYTLSEDGYDLTDYDVSTIVVNYYTDANGQTQVFYDHSATTETLRQQVIGGHTSAVSFNNFYTPSGTGAFAIHKSSAETGDTGVGSALQGAEFTLYSDETCEEVKFTQATNSRGSAYFSGLAEGTYYMKETKAPDGHQGNPYAVWKITVEETDDGIRVTVCQYKDEEGNSVTDAPGTVCYNGGILQSYNIQNQPNASTVRVTKIFSGLSAVEMEGIVKNSNESGMDPYYIRLEEDTANGERRELYLQNATRGQDGFTFTWTVEELPMENLYTISEHNYTLSAYVDTVVMAKVNDALQTDNKGIDRTGSSPVAKITGVQFHENTSDTVLLTNQYTNTFTLSLCKRDSETGKTLENASFDIYGSFREGSDTSKKITYTDPDTGVTTTYFYITTITSGTDGVATGYDLKLSEGSATFVYILDESTAPAGYTPGKPQAITVDVGSADYKDGVYSIVAPNTKQEHYVHRTLETEKVWEPGAPSGAEVTLELYRVSHSVRNVPLDATVEAERVATVTLDGTIDTNPEADPQTIYAYESSAWTVTWGNLPAASADYTEDDPVHYHYFVREAAVDGYIITYTCCDEDGNPLADADAIQALRVGENGSTTTMQGVLLADMDEAYTVSITNTASYALPATGGSGTAAHLELGAFLMLAAVLTGLSTEKRSKRRGAGHS